MEQVRRKKSLVVEYLLLAFVVLWSGGSFTYGMFINWPFLIILISTIIIINRKQSIDKQNWFIIAVFSLVVALHTLVFSGPITAMAIPVSSILALMLVATIVRPCFCPVYIRLLYFFALVSLFFWLIDLLPIGHSFLLSSAKNLPQFGGDALSEVESGTWTNRYTLYFYSISDLYAESAYYSIARNSGPFYEAGRYAIFLIIALSFILYNGDYKKYRKEFVVILLASVSTFSTTGYFVLFVLFLTYIIGQRKKVSITSFILIIFVVIAAYYIMDASFMGEKVRDALGETDNANSRFGAMYYHWGQITRSPLIGYGTFLSKNFNALEMSPCGITDMMRKWGIPVFVMCIFLLYRGSKSYLKNNKILRLSFVVVLLLLAYTQTVMDSPLYFLLYFMGGKDINYGSKV